MTPHQVLQLQSKARILSCYVKVPVQQQVIKKSVETPEVKLTFQERHQLINILLDKL